MRCARVLQEQAVVGCGLFELMAGERYERQAYTNQPRNSGKWSVIRSTRRTSSISSFVARYARRNWPDRPPISTASAALRVGLEEGGSLGVDPKALSGPPPPLAPGGGAGLLVIGSAEGFAGVEPGGVEANDGGLPRPRAEGFTTGVDEKGPAAAASGLTGGEPRPNSEGFVEPPAFSVSPSETVLAEDCGPN